MSHIIVFGLFLLATLLQSSFLPTPALIQAQPNLVLILVAAWGVTRGASQAIAWATIGGLLLGLTSAAPLGSLALALLPVALITYVGQLRLVADERLLALGVAFLGTLFYGAILILILQATGRPADWGDSYRLLFLPGALINALFIALAYPLIPWLESKLFPARE